MKNSVGFLMFFLFFFQLHAATKTWDGGGGDNNWTTAANWDLDVVAAAGDALVFAGAVRTTPVNDFANGTSFASITFSNGASSFSCSGNNIILSGGTSAITASNASNTMTISMNITFSTSAPTITTTSGGTLTLSGTVTNGGFKITIAGTGATIISGVISGTGGTYVNTAIDNLTIFSGVNTFTGDCDVEVGGLRITNASGCGTGTKSNDVANGTSGEDNLRLDGSGGDITLASTLSLYVSSSTGSWGGIINEAGNNTINGNMTLAAGGGGTKYRVDAGTLTLTGTYTPNVGSRNMRLDGSGNGVFSGTLVDAGFAPELRKYGSGTWSITGVNTYTGITDLRAGKLQLGASGVIPDASNLNAQGGTFSTGSGAGYSETMGTLTLKANTIIALGTGAHNINFAASNGTTWTAATLLRITGWQGAFNCSSGTSGKIYTGSSAELSAGKLAQIFFTEPISGTPRTACQLSDGEIVPTSTLPVKLVSFAAEEKNGVAHLNWITASEINSEYFEVLRSSDGINFESVGKVDAAGNSNDFIQYSFMDESPLQGQNYYRLAQYDFDGQKELFNIVWVSVVEKMQHLMEVYPSPTNGKTTFVFSSEKGGMYRLNILNVLGETAYSAIVAGIEGENKFNLNLSDFPNGTYIINVVNPQNSTSSTKFVKEN
jgi:autotransporter-associated beta strand protein